MANLDKFDLLSATQEAQLPEVRWQNGIDGKRRTAIEGVGGGMILSFTRMARWFYVKYQA